MATHDDVLAFLEHYVEQRRQRIAVLRQELTRLEQEQPALETTWAALSTEFEARIARADALQTNGHVDRSETGTRVIDRLVRLVIAAGRPMHVEEMQAALSQAGETRSKATLRSTCSDYPTLLRKVAPNTFDLPDRARTTIDMGAMAGAEQAREGSAQG
jgi:hypothetical protein